MINLVCLSKIKDLKKIDCLYLFLAVCIPLISIYLTFSNYIMIPQWDEYDVIMRFIDGENKNDYLSFLGSQNNEHRTFVTNLLFLIDYKIFNGFGYVSRLATFVILFFTAFELFNLFFKNKYLLQKTKYFNQKLNLSINIFLISISIILLFSPNQFENFVRSFNNQVFFVMCFNFLSLLNFYKFLNCESKKRIIYFSLSLLFAFLSTFSMASGIFSFVCILIFSIYSNQLLKKNYTYSLIVLIFSLISFPLFFYDYSVPGGTKITYINSFSDLINLFHYQLIFIGNIGNDNNFISILLAIISLIFFFYFLFLFFKNKKLQSNFSVLFLLIFFNAILIAQVNSIGRLFLGFGVASASRYITFVSFYWISIFVLFSIYINEYNLKLSYLNFYGLIFLTIILLSFPSSFNYFNSEFLRHNSPKNLWISGDRENELLNNLHPSPAVRDKVLDFLQKENKNIFYKEDVNL